MGLKNASLALINRVVAEWRATGKWPLTAVLRVQLKRENQNLDELVRGMPLEFYRNPSEAGIPESERLILSPAAVELADGGLADVTPLLELIRRGVKRRVTDPYRRAFVTTDDLREILGPGRVKDLPRLLEYCAEFWAGGGGISHEPTISRFGLDLHSIRYEKVNSGEQYMALFNPQPPRVEKWDQLDDTHKELVRLVYEYWREHGKWPLLAEFMVQCRDKGDVYTMLKGLPWTVLNTPTSLHDDQLAIEFLMSLRLRFLGFCVAAKDAEPSLFIRMLPIFHEHYEATVGSNKPITADEVAQRLGEAVEAVRRQAPLLEYEGHAGIVRTTPQDAAVWAVRITRDIDEWYDVKTIDDYIKRRIAHDKENSSAERALARVTA